VIVAPDLRAARRTLETLRVNNASFSNLAAIGPDAKAAGWAPRIPESGFVVVAGSDDRVLIAYGD